MSVYFEFSIKHGKYNQKFCDTTIFAIKTAILTLLTQSVNIAAEQTKRPELSALIHIFVSKISLNMINSISQLIDANRLEEALAALDAIVGGGGATAEVYYQRGRVNWRLGLRAAAVTDYEHAVALDSGSPARCALEMARDVEAFFNPDLLNP